MPKRLLYQGRAEVVSTEKERITLDKWLPSLPHLFRKVILPTAILAGSLFFTQLPAAPPPEVSVSSWQPHYVDRVQSKPSLPASILAGSCFYTRLEHPTPDRWQPTYPHRLIPAPRPTPSEPSFVWTPPPPPETITVDKWLGRYPDIRIKPVLPTSILGSSLFWADIPRAETITLDKWQPTYPTLILRPQLLRHQDIPFIWVAPPPETITLDKWLGSYPASIHRPAISRAILSGSLFIGDIPRAELITPDKWLPSYPHQLLRPVFIGYPDIFLISPVEEEEEEKLQSYKLIWRPRRRG